MVRIFEQLKNGWNWLLLLGGLLGSWFVYRLMRGWLCPTPTQPPPLVEEVTEKEGEKIIEEIKSEADKARDEVDEQVKADIKSGTDKYGPDN